MRDCLIVLKLWLRDLKKYWRGLPLLALSLFLYGLLMNVFDSLAASFGASLFYSFIRWFLLLAMMTHFAGLMNRLLQRKSLSMADLSSYDAGYLPLLSQIYFIFYLFELLASKIFPFFSLPVFLGLLLPIAWEIFKGPAFEAVYQDGLMPGAYVPKLMELWKENPIILALYSLLCLFLYFYLGRVFFLFSYVPGLAALPSILGKALLLTLYLYSKGILYHILTSSNPRGRAYREGKA